MQLNHLRSFVSVAEYLNFTEAARRMFVAQSAISQQIAQLEKEIGFSLFTRNKRTVQLTPAGIVFLSEAKEILGKADTAIEKALRAQVGYFGKLRIGFLAAPVRNFLPTFIRRFTHKYPEIELELFHFNLNQLSEKLVKNELDIIITMSIAIEHLVGIDYQEILSVPTCVFMHGEHHLAKKTTLSMIDLADEDFIMRNRQEAPEWHDHTLMLCSKHGFLPQKITQTMRIETVLMFVDSGLGIAIFPKYLQMYASPNLLIKEIENEDYIRIVVCHNKMNNNPSLNLFYEELQLLLTDAIK